MSLPIKPSRINFEAIDSHQLDRILKTGDIDSLTPSEREYFDLMKVVRGFHARMMMPGGERIVTKSGIIKLLKSDAYGLSDWMARQIYTDTLNFFYDQEGVTARAWSNIYADRLDNLAKLAISAGKLKEAKGYIVEAAKLRGCYDEEAPEIPQELLDAAPVTIYTADPEKDPTATKFDKISYDEIYNRGLKIMDLTATTLCRDNGMKIVVFDMDTPGNLAKVLAGETIGTLVY